MQPEFLMTRLKSAAAEPSAAPQVLYVDVWLLEGNGDVHQTGTDGEAVIDE